jgi:hypothetical protein
MPERSLRKTGASPAEPVTDHGMRPWDFAERERFRSPITENAGPCVARGVL